MEEVIISCKELVAVIGGRFTMSSSLTVSIFIGPWLRLVLMVA